MKSKKLVVKIGDIIVSKINYEGREVFVLCLRGILVKSPKGDIRPINTTACKSIYHYTELLKSNTSKCEAEVVFDLTLKDFEEYSVVNKGLIYSKELLAVVASQLYRCGVKVRFKCDVDNVKYDSVNPLIFKGEDGELYNYIELTKYKLNKKV